LIDELVVIDSDSTDGTAEIAESRGVTVLQRARLLTEFGPPLGKGDGIWRGLSATSGDIVMMMDTDTLNFGPHFLLGLLGPLFEHADIHFVKGAFHRPLTTGRETLADEGGRVTELVARPLLNLYLPKLAGFVQPLAGEVAARRWLLESIPIPVGYGIEIGVLIDTLREVGLDAMAQVDLGTRADVSQPLRDLTPMAYSVAATIISRVHGRDALMALSPGSLLLPTPEGARSVEVSLEERPPLSSLTEEDASGM
jgi:glucosyl-3-phosphoglycerate synthase